MIYAAVALSVILVFALAKLRRFGELHHGYWGLLLSALASALHWWAWVGWAGVVILFDDDVQHVVEAFGLRPRMADFTPIHKLGAWIMGINWKKLGWKAPIGIAILMAGAAIFCAVHFGV